MPQPSGAPSPDDYVNSQDYWDAYYAWLSAQFAAQNKAYSNISDYAWDTFATQPNWVEVTPDLPTVVVTAPRPLPPVSPIETFESPRDFEGYTYNPQTGTPYPPVWQMNDQEYADFLGGGDAAYEEMWADRHPDEPMPGPGPDPLVVDESFVLPISLLYPAVGTLATLGTVLLGGLGALFLPTPTAPRELDEAPTPPKPPRRNPTPEAEPDDKIPFLWPSVPEFTEPGPFPFALPVPRPGDMLDYNPRVRRVLPISDDPGVFADPAGLPDFPMPEPFPKPGTRPLPVPDRFTPDPLGDPFAPPIVDPRRPTQPFPDIPFDPWIDTPVPDTLAPPKVDAPPRIGDPFAPPGFDPTMPTPGFPYAPPGITFDPFTPPIDAPLPKFDGDKADKCNCAETKRKKKKKKQQSRTICYEGHYVEHARGLTKVRGKQIPCDTKATRAPRKRTPSLPDLARDVFQLPGV